MKYYYDEDYLCHDDDRTLIYHDNVMDKKMHLKIPKKVTISHFKVDEIIQEALFKADKEDAQMTALRGFVDLQVI